MTDDSFKLGSSSQDCADHPTLQVKDRNGNSYCFNCIIVAFQRGAYSLASRMLNDRYFAEDAVQESLISAYRSFDRFRGDNLRAWLMRIVANQCCDMLRSMRSRPTLPLDPVGTTTDTEETTLSVAEFPSGTESPEDAAMRGELRQAIQDALGSLVAERRMAILLVDVQGFSYEEAATIMNCSLGTVKSRVSRGRRELRDYLRTCGELLPASIRQEQ